MGRRSSFIIDIMKIERSDGITPSEKYLKKLCDRAFLSLWSYPGVFRDQKQGGKGDGKELCDLLVIFENHIIIFSDKYIEFPDSGNIQLDWSRWYRRAIKDSAEQIYGAERWIKKFPNRLFIDRNCTSPFPITLPDLDNSYFHRIVIAHGVSEKCREHFDGGSGSLLLDNTIFGDEHTGEECTPFTVGQVDKNKGYLHVFDEVTLDVILQTLDTVTDFVNYLLKKKEFLSSQVIVRLPGEEELLAFYLQNLNENGDHDFVLPKDINGLVLEEGFWGEFLKSPQRKAQQEANRISYAWDALIETFNKHILDDTQYLAFPKGINNQEATVKFLAKENRTRRRMLSTFLHELLAKTETTERRVRVIAPSNKGDPYYVFLVLPMLAGQEYSEYRTRRGKLLEAYCMVVKYKHPEAEDIVGFATESIDVKHRSEDLIYLDARQWSDQLQKDAEDFHNEYGFLRVTSQFRTREYEFPIQSKKRGRRRSKKK